jgi:hypothetical protein
MTVDAQNIINLESKVELLEKKIENLNKFILKVSLKKIHIPASNKKILI